MINDGRFKNGHIPWNKGRVNVYSKEVIQKISDGTRDWYLTHVHPFKGRYHTEETKERIRIKKIGKPSSRKGTKHDDKQYLLTLCRVCHPHIEQKTINALEKGYNPLEKIWGWL